MKHLHKDIDWTIFEFLEGNLSSEEAHYVEQQINSNEEWKQAHTRWKASYLEPETIPYPNISELTQPKIRFKITRNIQWYVAAASVFIVSLWFFGRPTYENNRKALGMKTASVLLDSTENNHKTETPSQVEKNSQPPQMPMATALIPSPSPKKRALPEVHKSAIQNTLAAQPSVNVGVLDSFSPTSAVKKLPSETKDPSMPNANIFELLASFFPGEIRKEARLSFEVIESGSGTPSIYADGSQRNPAREIFIDMDYFESAETPIPSWQQIWKRTKKGQLPAVQLALETQPNSWIPSMNVNLNYD